jgi:serine phosphatase RsbU (regulator of sigma subunit)
VKNKIGNRITIKKIKGTFLFLYLLLWVGQYSHISAQNSIADSLRKALKTESEDTNKVLTLNKLCMNLWHQGKYDTALVCANGVQALAEKLGFEKGMASAFTNMGIIFHGKGNYPKALEYYQKALPIYQHIGNKPGMANNLSNIGNIYSDQGNQSKALEYYFKSLVINQQLKEKSGMATNFTNIGLIYYGQGNSEKALEYEFKASELNQQLGDKNALSNNYINIGDMYAEQKNSSKALEYDLKSLDMAKQVGDMGNISANLINIAGIYATRAVEARLKHNALASDSLFRKAKEFNFQALAITKQMGDKTSMSGAFLSLGSNYISEKSYKNAKACIDSALRIAKEIGYIEYIKDSYQTLSVLDSANDNYKLALEDYKKYIAYRDSLVNEANTKKSVQAEMNYEFEQKQAGEKAEQDKKDAIAEQESKKQLIIRNAFIGGFALMLTLAFFIFRGYRQKQKANEIISEQKTVVEEKQKEILDSIHYAQRIQKALLASDSLLGKHLPKYFVLYKPKDIVSGDFYWATEKNNDFYLAICDSTGHGVPGAFMSLLNISFLNEAITEKNILQPNEVFNHTRKRLIENISQEGQQDGMDGVLMRFSDKNKMSYSGAYNAPIIVRNGQAIELEADKIPVGASPREHESFTNHSFDLQKGDIIYVFTDGFSDQFGGVKGKKFKHQQLQEKLLEISAEPLAQQKQKLESVFEEWKGKLEQVDDVLIVGIKV